MPEPKSLHIDAVLTNLSIQYKTEELIWEFLMPLIKVGKRSDKYYKYNKADSFTIPNDKIDLSRCRTNLTGGI